MKFRYHEKAVADRFFKNARRPQREYEGTFTKTLRYSHVVFWEKLDSWVGYYSTITSWNNIRRRHTYVYGAGRNGLYEVRKFKPEVIR